jgi:hypothetical protein
MKQHLNQTAATSAFRHPTTNEVSRIEQTPQNQYVYRSAPSDHPSLRMLFSGAPTMEVLNELGSVIDAGSP